MPLERAAATAVRLLDLGYFRIGADSYAEDNGSFGLTTLEQRHVRRRGDVDDAAAMEALDRMRKRRTASQRLLAFQNSRTWCDLDAAAVNAYLSELLRGEITAKDFRTWHAMVLAALALSASVEPGHTKASRRRAVKAAVEEVAGYLGNTPTIAKNSYIDPRVLDLYESATTIQVDPSRYRTPERRQAAVERPSSRSSRTADAAHRA